ncbi:MAG: nucleotide exchange factor GrpE [Clostridia bacterium]|nr:nucleotide exchange factor GrpE [Clostridia bacterium]
MKKDKENKTQPEQVQPETEETVEQQETVTEEEQPKEATIDEWREALETAVKQRDDYLDSLRRTQADFQNFKRRNQTSRADGYNDGVCESIEAMLPVIDNLERALSAAQPEDPLASGVAMTLKQLFDNLKKFGFEEVPALGEDFDPEKHNAVMREQSDEPGKVLEVFQKGYRVKDKIIRYAMVKVSVE